MTKGVKAKKHLGQHFLKNISIAYRIVSLLPNTDNKILEIGPGTGMLTQILTKNVRHLSVIEIDTESIEYLQKQPFSKQLTIHKSDFLKFPLSIHYTHDINIIGNFPYNISSQIIFKILDNVSTVGYCHWSLVCFKEKWHNAFVHSTVVKHTESSPCSHNTFMTQNISSKYLPTHFIQHQKYGLP